MRADELLLADHQVLRSLLRQLRETTPSEAERRRQLMASLATELTIHAEIEDQMFYRAVEQVSPLVSLAHAEHRQIDDQLAVVLRTDAAGERFADELRVLQATVEHHAHEEEREMFPESRALGEAELDALGELMAARRRALETSWLARARRRLKLATLRHAPT